MAEGPSRSTSAQTCTVPPESDSIAPTWLQYSLLTETEQVHTTGRGRVAALPKTGLDKAQLGRHDKRQVLTGDERIGMFEDPASNWNGSKGRNSTPRIQAADTPPILLSKVNDTPPARQESHDSAYESMMDADGEPSRADVDLQAANIRARERVEITRGRAFRTRRVISEKRQDVQFLREKWRDAVDKLMRAVNELIYVKNVQNIESLAALHQAVSDAQAELGPAEDAYDLLELRLSREEEELEREEMHFYTHNNISLAAPSDSKLDEALTPLIKQYEPDDPEPEHLNLDNELVQRYRARVAEAGHLKEQLGELENEQYRLTEDLLFRKRYDLPLSKEKETFLFEFPKVHQELLEALEQVEDDLYALRERCIDEDLFADDEYVYEPHDALVEEIYESVNDARNRSALYARHTLADYDVNFSDKQEYVNMWLLDWVQDSTVEIMKLKDLILFHYPKDAKELVNDEWAGLALEFWDHDHAGDFANGEQKLSTIDALLGGTDSSLNSAEREARYFGPQYIMSVGTESIGPRKEGQNVRIVELADVEWMRSEQGPVSGDSKRITNAQTESITRKRAQHNIPVGLADVEWMRPEQGPVDREPHHTFNGGRSISPGKRVQIMQVKPAEVEWMRAEPGVVEHSRKVRNFKVRSV